jgi:hypothetical protein
MCAVSTVGDFYRPQFQPYIDQGTGGGGGGISQMFQQISRAEFDELKRQVLDMKYLLIKAKEIDDKTGQPECEQEDKVKVLKTIAEALGVDLSEVFEMSDTPKSAASIAQDYLENANVPPGEPSLYWKEGFYVGRAAGLAEAEELVEAAQALIANYEEEKLAVEGRRQRIINLSSEKMLAVYDRNRWRRVHGQNIRYKSKLELQLELEKLK